jgi:hypothetical protein
MLGFMALGMLFAVAIGVVAVRAENAAARNRLARLELDSRVLAADHAGLLVSAARWARPEVLQAMWRRYGRESE